MKKLVLMSMVVLSTSAFAKVSSTAGVTSDFIWRGLSLSGGTAAQGTMTYSTDFGLSAGIFMSEQNTFTRAGKGPLANGGAGGADGLVAGTGGYLAAPYLIFGLPVGEYIVALQATYLNMGDSGINDFKSTTASVMNYGLSVSRAGLKLSAEYMPDYFNLGTTDMYLNLSYTHALDQGLNGVVAVGQTTFGDENKSYMTSYMDLKVAVNRTSADGISMEMGVTNSNQQNVFNKAKLDVPNLTKTYVSLTKAF